MDWMALRRACENAIADNAVRPLAVADVLVGEHKGCNDAHLAFTGKAGTLDQVCDGPQRLQRLPVQDVSELRVLLSIPCVLKSWQLSVRRR